MPAATITTTAAPAFEIPKGSWGYRVYNNSDTAIYVLENAAVLTTTGIPIRPGSERVVAFAERNQNPMTLQAIHGGSGDKNMRYEILTVQAQALTGAAESTTLDASDLQIGAVEIKDGATDTRAKVVAASTEAASTDVALVTAQRPSEVVLGKTVGVSTIVTSAVVFTDTNARATGDYCGTDTTPQAFANAVRVSGGTGVIKSVRITDYTTTAAVDMELWLFSATFTAPADNAAWTVTDAEALTCLGVIPLPADKWYASGANKVFSDDTLGMVIKPAATSLFYALVARGTTPAWTTAAGLQLALGILQD